MGGDWDLEYGSSGLRPPMKPLLAQVGMTEINTEKLMDIYEMVVFNKILFPFKARNFLLLKLKLLNQTLYFIETVSLKSDVLCKSASICWLLMIPNARGEIASVTHHLPKSANSKTFVYDCLCQSIHVLKGSIFFPVQAARESTRLQLPRAGVVEYPLQSSEMLVALSGLDCPWDSWTF